MIRRVALFGAAALFAVPLLMPGTAGASTVIGQCTGVAGSTHLNPGLSNVKTNQTGTSPDTVTGATADTFSGCSQTGGGGPTSATWTSNITSTMPLACPHALGGPPDPPPGTIIFTGTTHIVWNSGPASDASVKVKQTATVGQVKVVSKFTAGQFFLAGHVTKSKVTFAFSPNGPFNCATGSPPLAHVNISNVGNAVTTRT